MYESRAMGEGGAACPCGGARRHPVNPGRDRQATTVSRVPSLELRQLVDAACRSTLLDRIRLTEEFYPGHLSVALIDAVFHPRLRSGGRATAAALASERYCRHFGVARTRPLRSEPPAVETQETLGNLLRHFDVYGMDRMAREVFQVRSPSSGAKYANVQCVLHAAAALRAAGTDVLQDVQSMPPESIEAALRPVPGVGARTIRLFMMYAGDDDFVRGDMPVRRFVASALGRRSISAAEAESLVQRAAYELILSPRFLDCVIWDYGASGDGLAKPPAPGSGLRGTVERTTSRGDC